MRQSKSTHYIIASIKQTTTSYKSDCLSSAVILKSLQYPKIIKKCEITKLLLQSITLF